MQGNETKVFCDLKANLPVKFLNFLVTMHQSYQYFA